MSVEAFCTLAPPASVLAIHPPRNRAARDRFSAAAGKSDVFDSFVLSEWRASLPTAFHALAPSSDETIALTALVRTREDLVEARGALANQLYAQLDCS